MPCNSCMLQVHGVSAFYNTTMPSDDASKPRTGRRGFRQVATLQCHLIAKRPPDLQSPDGVHANLALQVLLIESTALRSLMNSS